MEAEKEAQSIIDRSRSQAQSLLEKAEDGSRIEHSNKIEEFRQKRITILEEEAKNAIVEAEKIKRDGIELANGLSGRSKERIPLAVKNVMELLRDQD